MSFNHDCLLCLVVFSCLFVGPGGPNKKKNKKKTNNNNNNDNNNKEINTNHYYPYSVLEELGLQLQELVVGDDAGHDGGAVLLQRGPERLRRIEMCIYIYIYICI